MVVGVTGAVVDVDVSLVVDAFEPPQLLSQSMFQ